MRNSKFFYFVLSLFLLVPASITWAQTISSQKGLTTAVFQTQYGNVKVYLPDDIRPGDMISGSILTEPFGKNSNQKEKNLAELIKYNIVIDNNKIVIPSKQEDFNWVISRDRQLTMPMELMNISGIKSFELTLKINLNPTILIPSKDCIIPTHTLTGSPLRLTGSFDGNSSNTNCTLNGQACEIIAESPRLSIIQLPVNSNGIQTLTIKENNLTKCSQKVSGVEMMVSSGKLNLQKGERTYIDVSITGLQNLPDTAILTLINLSADVVTMKPKNTFFVPLTPDSVSSGFFSKRFEILSLKTGTFNVNVNLDLPEQSEGIEIPPIQFEQNELAEPRQLEDKALQIGLHVAIKKLIGDAGGARGKEWNTICDNCRGCIEARMGEWAADLVKDLGVGMIKESVGKAIDLVGKAVKIVGTAKDFFDKISEKVDNAEQLANDIEAKVRAGELKVMELKPQFCVKSSYCLISGTIFYNPKTGCVFAIIYCQGTKLCCPENETVVTITYCTDEKGMPKNLPDIGVIKK